MNVHKKLVLATAMSSLLVIAGCGGSGSDTASDDENVSSQSINGMVSAPAGAVARYERKSVFEIALSLVVSEAAAAITGLEPVKGADVELIRVDDDGNQVGEVLAKTVTSITGDYQLTLPQNVNLAGNLIVRITGSNDAQMRAQVVEKAIDINPVSEFVLRKFIQQGADLDQLVTTDVVKLSGQVEEFDLTAGADLSDMLNRLEQETGEFVENQIAVVTAAPGDVSAIAGDYRSSAFNLALEDSDSEGYGSLAWEVWTNNFSFADAGNGVVSLTLSDEESAEVGLSGSTVSSGYLWYESELDEETETLPASLSDTGILSIEGEFEEEVDGDYGWRLPPTVYNLQRVKDKGLFVVLSQEAEVSYGTVDTDGDNEKDALDPDARRGDEVFRGLEFFARKPSGMKAADLNGEFGRVYIESYFHSGGPIELLTETNTLTFNGDGIFDYNGATGHRLSLSGAGTAYTTVTDAADAAVPIVVSADGDIEKVDSTEADGYVNDSFDFITFTDAVGADQTEGQLGTTLMVKLPTSTPSVNGKTYRLMLLSLHLSGAGNGTSQIEMANSHFNTFINMTSESSATLTGKFTSIEKENLAGELVVKKDIEDEEITNLAVNIAANGATTITVPADGSDGGTVGANILEGFFNENASLGIFTEYWQPEGGDPDELGVAVLVEVSE